MTLRCDERSAKKAQFARLRGSLTQQGQKNIARSSENYTTTESVEYLLPASTYRLAHSTEEGERYLISKSEWGEPGIAWLKAQSVAWQQHMHVLCPPQLAITWQHTKERSGAEGESTSQGDDRVVGEKPFLEGATSL